MGKVFQNIKDKASYFTKSLFAPSLHPGGLGKTWTLQTRVQGANLSWTRLQGQDREAHFLIILLQPN